MTQKNDDNILNSNIEGVSLTCSNQVCKHHWIYRGHAKFYAQCPICMRKVKIPGMRPSPQEAAHEDLKHIPSKKENLSQQMFRNLYSVARQMANDKHEALRMALAAHKEKYELEPEYEKEYWLESHNEEGQQ